VGHAGTLDPDATGVLLVGLGRATRLLRFLTALPKSYCGEIVLGRETTTLDSAGSTVAEHDMSGVTLDDVRVAAASFVGRIEQIPPMVSAVKVGGQRLYKLARAAAKAEAEAGDPAVPVAGVERAPRPVTVHRLTVTPTGQTGVFAIEVECSSGTYVRSLAADIGTVLGGGAHLRNLRRTAIGSFTAAEATLLDDLDPRSVLSPAEALRDYPTVSVDADIAEALSHGKSLSPDVVSAARTSGAPAGDEPGVPGALAVIDPAGQLLGVYEQRGDGWWRPAVVMAGQ